MQVKGFKLKRDALEILQVNLGYKCNLGCTHCHVNAGPTRLEQMDYENVNAVLEFIFRNLLKFLILQGGAPELNPNFKYLVEKARSSELEVIDRCNLTVLLEPGFEDLSRFLADYQVTITASLPAIPQAKRRQTKRKRVFFWIAYAHCKT